MSVRLRRAYAEAEQAQSLISTARAGGELPPESPELQRLRVEVDRLRDELSKASDDAATSAEGETGVEAEPAPEEAPAQPVVEVPEPAPVTAAVEDVTSEDGSADQASEFEDAGDASDEDSDESGRKGRRFRVRLGRSGSKGPDVSSQDAADWQ